MTDKIWDRAIILVDMNAFFASVDQHDFPEWRGQPLAVTNGKQGTCIITSSYEARSYGIKTGMRLKEALKLCPHLVRSPSRPKRYAEVSGNIMQALESITPDIEIFSVDEAFLDVSRCQKSFGSPIKIARRTKQVVFDASGLSCSLGLSGDKTTAKYAAKLQKPNGFTVVPPWEAERRLRDVPVTELCGIAQGIGRFLASYGVYRCGDMQKLPISILGKRFGNLGRRIWFMCQGADPALLQPEVGAPKTLGHGKVMPPRTTDQSVVLTYLLHMSERVGKRLRRHELQAQHFFIGLRSHDHGWLGAKARLVEASNDGREIYQLGCQVLGRHWQGQPVAQIQVTALDPKPSNLQKDLFLEDNLERAILNRALDELNQRYGEFTVAPARLLNRSTMHNVIAPAWKPHGHRQTV